TAPLCPPDVSSLSLHDALPILTWSPAKRKSLDGSILALAEPGICRRHDGRLCRQPAGELLHLAAGSRRHRRRRGVGRHACLCPGDRKSTRLNSSHVKISYAVFC